MKFATLLDAACHLIRFGYAWSADYQCFRRGSWYARLEPLKNGKCRVVTY